MREIKFRVWDKKENKIIDWWTILNHYNLNEFLDSVSRYFNRYIIMQYTGLKDKCDTEVCEGDIVRYDHAIHPLRLITFDDGGFNYKIPECDTPHCFRRLASGIARLDMEVIGNVYENPELLEVDLNEV